MASSHPGPAMPSSRGRRKKPPPAESAPPPARDWAALPRDILFAIFLKLGPREIMRGAELACTAWRRAAVDEPALWRRLDLGRSVGLPAIARAVDRSAGQCEAFMGPADGDLLLYLVERATSLKILRLIFLDASNGIFNEAISKLSLLQDLDLEMEYSIRRSEYECVWEKLFESVCQACPHLKKFRSRKFKYIDCGNVDCWESDGWESHDGETLSIPTMPELHSIELSGYSLSKAGLTAILDNCPQLESLDISCSFVCVMDEELLAKCARVKNLTLPIDYDSDEEYYRFDSDEEYYRLEDYGSDTYDYRSDKD